MKLDYDNMSEREKSEFALKYQNLVMKMTRQYADQVHIPWKDIESMAWEGFTLAMIRYNPDKSGDSKMSFTQYAAYEIRNNICTRLNEEARPVKLSTYAQNKAKERGEVIFNTVSIDERVRVGKGGDDNEFAGNTELKYNVYEEADFEDGDIWGTVFEAIEQKFSARDCDVFYKTYGLNGRPVVQGKDIAAEYHVSAGLISMIASKIARFIKNEPELADLLRSIL